MTKRKKRNLTWLYVLIGLIVVGAIVMAVLKGQKQSKGLEIQTEEAEKRTIKELISASGRVYPEIEVKVGSDVSGKLVKLFVAEGDSVTKGKLLARINPDIYESAVERGQAAVDNSKAQVATTKANQLSAEASLQQAIAQKKQIEAQIVNAQAIFSRNGKLLKEGVISQADYDSSLSSLRGLEANLESAEASIRSARAGVQAAEQNVKASEFSVKSAKASLKETKTNLNRTSIFAPMSGIVSYLGKKEGEIVLGTTQMTGDVIFKIANISSMEVQADVSESDILKVAVGNDAVVEVDAYLGRKFTGRVTEIANSASNTTGKQNLSADQVTNFVVKIRIDRNSYKDLITPTKRFAFRPGMSASVDIVSNTQENVVSVPIQSVTMREIKGQKNKDDDDDLSEVVFLVQGDSVSMRTVKTAIQDDKYIQITEGVQVGDVVASGPYSAISKKLKSGKKIEIKEKKK